ncbi:hypothetical protein, partial [Sinorhizobium meliloti]|uniref:hypothetical protein n=1 Tax=Rhizobium meliloti TaxID=382 RepID=UPI001AEC998A
NNQNNFRGNFGATLPSPTCGALPNPGPTAGNQLFCLQPQEENACDEDRISSLARCSREQRKKLLCP